MKLTSAQRRLVENQTPKPGNYQSHGYEGVEKELINLDYHFVGEKFMSFSQIIRQLGGYSKIPYFNDVLEIYNNPSSTDRDWEVYQKIIEYSNYLKKHPQTVQNLPPIVLANNNLKDGAHRLSALGLLAYLDPSWFRSQLRVRIYNK
jgi:hypothetical protein